MRFKLERTKTKFVAGCCSQTTKETRHALTIRAREGGVTYAEGSTGMAGSGHCPFSVRFTSSAPES